MAFPELVTNSKPGSGHSRDGLGFLWGHITESVVVI
jgi:hypothetical protein